MIVSKNKAVSLSKILGLVLVIFSIVIVILFFRGNERFKIFRLSAETPSIINYYLLRGAVKNRNFDHP